MSKEIKNLSRSELIKNFVISNPDYYINEFKKIGSKPSYSYSFNLFAALFGPVWFGLRNVWNYALAFLIVETFAVVQIVRGLFGNITKDAVEKIDKIQSTIDFRYKQLEAAKENNPEKVEVYERAIKSLEEAMKEYVVDVQQIEASAIWITISGILLLIFVKFIQGILANTVLEKRYSEWLSNKSISPGMKPKNYLLSIGFTIVIMFFSVIHYSFPGFFSIMNDFPTHPEIRLTSIKWVETIFDYAVIKGDAVFTAITIGGKYIHNYLAFAFMLGLALAFVLWVRHNIPNKVDWEWIKMGGGIFKAGLHPPAKKFNAGQKMIFWITMIGGLSVSMSGIALMFPFQTTM